jgi:O-methyltransferase involved in polyketide biosynthesis
MKYSIDTSAILDGWARYFPPDVIPGLWDNLEKMVLLGELIATEEVYYELQKKNDDVFKWAKKNKQMFIPIDESIQIAVKEILSEHKKLIDTRKNRSGADPFVIALASTNNCKVLTGENKTNSIKRPHIPDICDALGIKWINIWDLCREQKWKFGN